MVLMDTAIIANPQTWVASGHAGAFGDALIDDKNTKQRFRADKIIENYIENKITANYEMRLKDQVPSHRQCGEVYLHIDAIKKSNNEESSSKKEIKKFIEEDLCKELNIKNIIPESWGNEKMTEFIKTFIPNNPDTGKLADWTDARQFNLMLQTQLGVIEDASAKAYLRPETCQSLFTNFKNLINTTRVRVPFGMAQVGKAFRNEITPGQFLYRTREFEQMEIEYFVENDLEKSK